MPPSGYNHPQTLSICTFLNSCSEALSRECSQKQESLHDGLKREIADIDRYCRDTAVTPIQLSVLQLTRAFYQSVLEAVIQGSDYADAVHVVLTNIKNQVLAIHIPQ